MIWKWVIIAVYSLSLMVIFLYSLATFNLLINYVRSRRHSTASTPPDQLTHYPKVTIQLPLYNELYVVERLLDNIVKLDYPSDKLEIQVLDDSTDESFQLTASIVERLRQDGHNISHVKRPERTAFKAGALKYGLALTDSEFIAIFDADFLPPRDWLKKTLPHFQANEVGVVQTRWGHLNQTQSLLTRVQAFALDIHFTLEQRGRNTRGHFINFNGTAGVWRRKTIEDAGNWQGDTLTEDLDLSYRAQLKGWKFKYLEEVVAPAELPMVVSAARSQQFRWNKGGAENFRKSVVKLLQNKDVGIKTKIHGVIHLLNSTMFLSVLLVAVLSIPMLYIKHSDRWFELIFYLLSFFLVSSLLFFISYWVMYKRTHGSGLRSFIRYTGAFFVFFTVAMGFSLHNSIAVLQGHLGIKSDFIRTPKFNKLSTSPIKNKYLSKNLSVTVFFEGLLALYFAFGMYSAFVVGENGDFGLFAFHLMLFLGFGYVFVRSIIEQL